MDKIMCQECNSSNIIKKGTRKNKNQTIQRYKCKTCSKIFTQKGLKHKSYPAKIILNAISNYNLGNTLERAAKLINSRFKTNITPKNVQLWVNEFKEQLPYFKVREEGKELFSPKDIIHKQALNHIQPYTFKCHNAKLHILAKENPQFSALKDYIEKINSKDFPDHIFTYNKNNSNNTNIEQRASQLKFNHLKITHVQKQNQANQLAKLALNLAATNKQRHQAIQDFMLINDSTTIATEIPVYLTNWDAGYYRNQKGFIFPLNNYTTPITGHIDILQIRNKLIHILDYKPEANKIHPIEQLTIYAMALSRKLNLELYHFKCAWFDENNYFEFFPLQGVYEKQK